MQITNNSIIIDEAELLSEAILKNKFNYYGHYSEPTARRNDRKYILKMTKLTLDKYVKKYQHCAKEGVELVALPKRT